MLENFKNIIANIEAFNFGAELEKIVIDNTDEIVKLQQQQLYAGVDRNNEPILLGSSPNYAPFTIEEKTKKGQPVDRITWKDTGELYASLETKVNGNLFEVISDNEKFGIMVRRSGRNVVGLDESSRLEFAETITLPEISAALKAKTGLTITTR